jgi:phosphatidyl-myo-inositol dimannoside synthase
MAHGVGTPVTRTLWVTNDFPPRPGGIEHFLGGLVDRLPHADVRVLATPWPGDREHDAALPYRVERTGRRPLLPTRQLLRQIRQAGEEHRADVVVFGAAWPLGELGRHLEWPSVGLSHGHEAGMARIGLGPLLRRTGRALDAVGVISQFTHGLLAPWLDGLTRVEDLPPGVDTALFHPGVDGTAIRARYGIAVDQPLVVCLSRLVARKGQDMLVEAWPDVLARVPGAHLLLGGSGPQEPRIARRRRALGLEESVTMAGEIPWERLPAFHAAADVFAMPCRTRLAGLDVEGLGIVFLEAQASGTPVVVGRSGGAPETVIDGETGLVVDGRSPAEVADAIATLLSDPDRRKAMGDAGRQFVEQRFAWEVIALRMQRLLDELAT